MARRARPATVLRGDFGLSKIGVPRFDYSDPYHLAVSVSWAAFVAGLLALWLLINLVFAALYFADPGGVANAEPGSFAAVFFFSVETLATVGYGVMAPATLYSHVVSSAEVVTGTAFTAIVTGLVFVRFSRPRARIIFADNAVVATHNGHKTLMIRLVNGRMTAMLGANARLFALISERTAEGHSYRRIHDLRLVQSHLPLFIMPWTLMHRLDADSPLAALGWTDGAAADTRLFLTVSVRDQALATEVHDVKDYSAKDVAVGMRYADSVTVDDAGNAVADISRISLLEPDA